MSKRRKRDVYIAIMRAAARGEGLSLTAAEVHHLSFDDAIATRANGGMDQRDIEIGDWSKANPYRKRRNTIEELDRPATRP